MSFGSLIFVALIVLMVWMHARPGGHGDCGGHGPQGGGEPDGR